MDENRIPVSDFDSFKTSCWSPSRRPEMKEGPDARSEIRQFEGSEFARSFCEQCQIASEIYDFVQAEENRQAIRRKTQALNRLESTLSSPAMQRRLSVQCLKVFMWMIEENLSNRRFIGEPFMEAIDISWPHISMIYSILDTSLAIP